MTNVLFHKWPISWCACLLQNRSPFMDLRLWVGATFAWFIIHNGRIMRSIISVIFTEWLSSFLVCLACFYASQTYSKQDYTFTKAKHHWMCSKTEFYQKLKDWAEERSLVVAIFMWARGKCPQVLLIQQILGKK